MSRNPLTGLSGLQPLKCAKQYGKDTTASQSPYGAKWFATLGYNLVLAGPGSGKSQSPYGAKWFATLAERAMALIDIDPKSQSPYGAMSFATSPRRPSSPSPGLLSRNPLTGLCRLQLYPPKNAVLDSTAGRGFVRKMKLGICIGQRVDVLRGLGR